MLAERADDMAFFAERVEKTPISRLEAFVNAPFERIDYTDAVEILQEIRQEVRIPGRMGRWTCRPSTSAI